jgi:hypothetical protein
MPVYYEEFFEIIFTSSFLAKGRGSGYSVHCSTSGSGNKKNNYQTVIMQIKVKFNKMTQQYLFQFRKDGIARPQQ